MQHRHRHTKCVIQIHAVCPKHIEEDAEGGGVPVNKDLCRCGHDESRSSHSASAHTRTDPSSSTTLPKSPLTSDAKYTDPDDSNVSRVVQNRTPPTFSLMTLSAALRGRAASSIAAIASLLQSPAPAVTKITDRTAQRTRHRRPLPPRDLPPPRTAACRPMW